jgi:hypothetical protein
MDSVRHLTRDLLKLTIQVGVKLDDEISQKIFSYILNPAIYMNTRCILIGSICAVIKTDALLTAIPKVIDMLLQASIKISVLL